MKRKWIVIIPAAILGIVLFTALGGQIVRLLWNWLLPSLFGFPQITFWQAIGLLALCRILFGGNGLLGGGRSKQRMTPEEKERFRQRMRERFGFGAATNERDQPTP
ncbi:MAG TPA: hypothetical protein VMU84_20145 [Thermoanaerobaculia bacterium]|nr:hypothetical protein [Thermoanaerobaculia bacterium]